jgi:hypothetical protein
LKGSFFLLIERLLVGGAVCHDVEHASSLTLLGSGIALLNEALALHEELTLKREALEAKLEATEDAKLDEPPIEGRLADASSDLWGQLPSKII